MRELTSEQITEWEAWNVINPIGDWRDDFRTAKLEALVTNLVSIIYHDKKKASPVLKTAFDFMPKWGEGKKKKVIDQQQINQSIKSAFLGMIKAQNKKGKAGAHDTRIPVSKQTKKT